LREIKLLRHMKHENVSLLLLWLFVSCDNLCGRDAPSMYSCKIKIHMHSFFVIVFNHG
jgi:hypothetical protein